MPPHSQTVPVRVAEHRVDGETDPGRGQHHAFDGDVDDPGAFAPQPGHGAEHDRRPEPQRLDGQVRRRSCRRFRRGPSASTTTSGATMIVEVITNTWAYALEAQDRPG